MTFLDVQISCTPGKTNASTIDFFENIFTFSNQSVKVNCCHLNKTIELATCGRGASCAGKCSALGASLCPSGNCSGDCEIPFDDISERSSMATGASSCFRWCSPRCDVWRHRGCCYNPVCNRKRAATCQWMNYLTGITISATRQSFL